MRLFNLILYSAIAWLHGDVGLVREKEKKKKNEERTRLNKKLRDTRLGEEIEEEAEERGEERKRGRER